MSCERCKDIHDAQKSGATQDRCKCPCHNTASTTTVTGDPNSLTFINSCTGGGTSTYFDLGSNDVTLQPDGSFS